MAHSASDHDEVAYGEGVMAGKYSAEWWEKIVDLNRESPERHDRSTLVLDVVQARTKQAPAQCDAEAEKAGARQ